MALSNKILHNNNVKPTETIFKIYNQTEVLPLIKRYIDDSRVDLSGLLVEHVNWYKDGQPGNFDPRLYVVVKGFDERYYFVSFKDYVRKNEIANYEGISDDTFLDLKIIPFSEITDGFCTADPDRISDSLSLDNPVNIYVHDPRYELVDAEKMQTYKIYGNDLFTLKLITAIYSLYDKNISNIVLALDSSHILTLQYSYFRLIFKDYNKSKYYPKDVKTYDENNTGLIVCDNSIAKLYEQNGFRLLELLKRSHGDDESTKER